MHLIPFIREIWPTLLLVGAAWLLLPALLVWKGKDRWAIAVILWWAFMFFVTAGAMFEFSSRPSHPNAFVGIGSSFFSVAAFAGGLSALGTAAVIAIYRYRLKLLVKNLPAQGSN